MSRGHGVVQRFILDHLAAGHPEPDLRRSILWTGGPRRIGHPLHAIAATYAPTEVNPYTGAAYASRSTMTSFGRAMATLQREGLVEVRYWPDGSVRYLGNAYLRLSKKRPAAARKC